MSVYAGKEGNTGKKVKWMALVLLLTVSCTNCGYYVGDFAPYDFIGRFGPSCPYCQGGYVSFEILTDVDVTKLKSGKDWIKVTGILREGNDTSGTKFCYIEALKLEKMDSAGQDTVTN